MKFGRGDSRWQRAISSRQMRTVCWSAAASSRTPQRRSTAWNLYPRASHSARSRGNTERASAFRSTFRSENVELTKTRNVCPRTLPVPASPISRRIRHPARQGKRERLLSKPLSDDQCPRHALDTSPASTPIVSAHRLPAHFMSSTRPPPSPDPGAATPSRRAPVTFAAVGDVHGAMHAMVRLLDGWETAHRRHIDFVLQVGDFEPHRHEADLESASIPTKYRDLGDFPDFAAGRARFDWPIYFIGGNHEPFGFLESMPNGGLAAPNCRYLGRVGRVEVGGLTVVGLTGIYSELGLGGRPPRHAMARTKKKLYAYFSEEDVERAISHGRADVLVLHEWPRGAIQPDQRRACAACAARRAPPTSAASSREWSWTPCGRS